MAHLANEGWDARYERLAELARTLSGQSCDARKSFLLEVRLKPVMDMLGLSSVDDLLERVGREVPSNLASYFADALIDSETWFFRERDRLQAAATLVASSLGDAGRNGPVRVWCAGGSTGQEAISLAILLDETLPDDTPAEAVRIVTSDIGYRATSRARTGIYSHFEIQHGLSASRMLKYFTGHGERDWRASPALLSCIEARHHNLLDGPLAAGAFDLVLCRNVLGGMQAEDRARVSQALAAALKPRGCVIVGHGETMAPATGVAATGGTGGGIFCRAD